MPYDNLPDCLKEFAKLLVIKNCLKDSDKADDNTVSNIARKYLWDVLTSKLLMSKYEYEEEQDSIITVDYVNYR